MESAVPSSARTWGRLRRRPARVGSSLKMTFSGLLSMIVVVLIGLAAMNGEANLLILLFGISVGAVGLSAFLPVLMVRKLAVTRSMPDVVVAGRSFTVIYTVRSLRRWGRAWSLSVGEMGAEHEHVGLPCGYIPVLEAGETLRLELVGRCPYRGRVELQGIRLQSRFPLGLFTCTVDIPQPAELLVFPTVGRLRRDVWKDIGAAESVMARPAMQRGGVEEFYGVREYLPGDSTRWIHWRRSAHTGQLVVRESAPILPAQTILLLDLWPEEPAHGSHVRRGWELLGGGPAPRPDPVVERLISAAATLACDALERGHRVGLIARGRVAAVVAPAGGRGHRQRLLHELALLRPGGGESLEQLATGVRWSVGWRARCLLFAPRRLADHDRVMHFLGTRADSARLVTPGSDWLEGVFTMASGIVPGGTP